jgi:hypothetical protein
VKRAKRKGLERAARLRRQRHRDTLAHRSMIRILASHQRWLGTIDTIGPDFIATILKFFDGGLYGNRKPGDPEPAGLLEVAP